jgi:hypothetical protein
VIRELRQRHEDLQVKEITGAAEFEEALEEGDFAWIMPQESV